MTPDELAALPELPAGFVPWREPQDPTCVWDAQGRAWQMVRLGEPEQRWKVRRPGDDRGNVKLGAAARRPSKRASAQTRRLD